MNKDIAVLITCHNRKNKTLQSLKFLNKAISNCKDTFSFKIYLVDDGSTDGTSETVRQYFPSVNVIQGTGDLFWAGGMRLAWSIAFPSNPDYYLLLNDDTFLCENAITSLLREANNFQNENLSHAILVGSTIDKQTSENTYGGRKLNSKWRPNGNLIQNNKSLTDCDLGEANIMLIPLSVVKKIGILSDKYTHGMADYDYTLRAKEAGFRVLVLPGILGVCEHDHGKGWLSTKHSLRNRISFLYSPKGLAYKEYLFFVRRHFPLYLPEAFLKLWLKTLFPVVYDLFKKK